ncbi:sulfatase-like hydrolase/transferase [Agaribacterium haliotis]|uniref:sulfatase-like hydrolase/transferase n=1 Tax=Agaribacterium haliotis TaxID=2013869 RepID=UPI000BB58195|nr:sulfatase-like hydrolase/transferase [Agaribacterium haliotis]
MFYSLLVFLQARFAITVLALGSASFAGAEASVFTTAEGSGFTTAEGLVFTTAEGSPNQGTPNIVLIVADYMGYADIEPYGARDVRTPGINRLAQEGIKFNSHYTSAPMCIPARASLLSGSYPAKVRRGPGLHADDNRLLRGLKNQGYRTAVIGKWHLGSSEGFHPLDHGFDYFYGFDSWTLAYHSHLDSDGEPGLYKNRERIDQSGYLTELFSQEASRFIFADNKAKSKHNKQPFFLYLAYNVALPPYQAPNLKEELWHTGWAALEAGRKPYVAMIEAMDAGIYSLLKQLDEQGLSDNTLVIFTYDHGGRNLADTGPLFHGFGSLWEGGIRVPLLIRWPGKIQSGKEQNTPSIIMDLTATMLAAAGVNVDSGANELDGRSLLNQKLFQESAKNRALYWRWRDKRAVRQGPWKYLSDNHNQFLFDVSKDPGERNNLFFKQPKKAAELKNMLERF